MQISAISTNYNTRYTNYNTIQANKGFSNNNARSINFSKQDAVSFTGQPNLNIFNKIYNIFNKYNIPAGVIILDEQKQARTAHNKARKAFSRVRKLICDSGINKIANELSQNPAAVPKTFSELGIKSPVTPWRKTSADIKQYIKPAIIKGLISEKSEIPAKTDILVRNGLVKNSDEFQTNLKQYLESSQTAKNLRKTAKMIKEQADILVPEFKTAQAKYQQAILQQEKAKSNLNLLEQTLDKKAVIPQNRLQIAKDNSDIAENRKVKALENLKNTAKEYETALDIVRNYLN